MQSFEKQREATWIDSPDSSDPPVSLLQRGNSQHFQNAATTNLSRVQRADSVVMLAKPCGRSEMNTPNRDFEFSSELKPMRSHFKIGIRVIFGWLILSWLIIQTRVFSSVLTHSHGPSCSQMLPSNLQTPLAL